jgi:hypothetical protein
MNYGLVGFAFVASTTKSITFSYQFLRILVDNRLENYRALRGVARIFG